MRCLSPRTVGFKDDGKTISWSPKCYSKEYPTFQLPCGKCLECRLEYARQWAVRCVHEAKMHERNCFITLTYSDQHLKSPKLELRDMQLFIKRLRKHVFKQLHDELFPNLPSREQMRLWNQLTKERKNELWIPRKISTFYTGEYGDRTKRPHWHALLFNWRPQDERFHRTSDRGDRIFKSSVLESLWPVGHVEYGSVTFESAGYCARYAAKKLVHGHDDTHDFHPISRKSSHRAIGRSFLEANWRDIFNHGHVVLGDGTQTTIPRYYEKWLAKHHWEDYLTYLVNVKNKKIRRAELRSAGEKYDTDVVNYNRTMQAKWDFQVPKEKVRYEILKAKFAILQKHLKGDI